jgi:hypothetical protein
MNMRLLRGLAGLWLIFSSSAALAAQGSGCVPTTGTVSGLTMAQDINAGIAALISTNSGASAPATDCTAVAIKGQLWLDTSLTPNILRQYDGVSTWVPLGALDATNHLWSPPIGGGTATIASATTADLWSSNASSITISGTTSIIQLASGTAVPGTVKMVVASGAFVLTYDATKLILPGAQNITTAAGDSFEVVALTSTNVKVINYTHADGSALTNPAIPLGAVFFGHFGTLPPKTVYGAGQALTRTSYPAYLAAVTRAQTGTLTSGNNTITSVGNTAGLGAGMPIEGTGIPASTTISSVTGSTIVMSANATSNGAQTATAFLTGYGISGSSSTVGVTDCRGRTLAGRDDLGGTAASRLTSGTGNFGVATAINATGGAQNTSVTLLTANLPPYTPAGTNGTSQSAQTGILSGGTFQQFTGGTVNSIQNGAIGSITVNAQPFTGTPQGGTSTPFTFGLSQPTVIAECVVAVLP